MGEIAEMMLDGILDEQTGEYIDDEISHAGGCGYPRSIHERDDYKTHHKAMSPSYGKPYQRWTTAKGKKIRITQMSNTHLKNAINLIKSRVNWRCEWLPYLKKELESRK